MSMGGTESAERPQKREKMEIEAEAMRAAQHASAQSAPTKAVRVAEQQLKIRVRKRETVPETDAAEQADRAIAMSTDTALPSQRCSQPAAATPEQGPSAAGEAPQPTAAQLSQLMRLMQAASRASAAPEQAEEPAPMQLDEENS